VEKGNGAYEGRLGRRIAGIREAHRAELLRRRRTVFVFLRRELRGHQQEDDEPQDHDCLHVFFERSLTSLTEPPSTAER
jgi:hypothetical protein